MTNRPAIADTGPAPDVIDIAMRLLAVESTTGHERNVVQVAETLLRSMGWQTSVIPVSAGRNNLLASVDGAPILVFSTHLDTVPPWIPPKLDGDRLSGRGSCDAKGIAAAMICAASRLRARGLPVGLLLVVGEEATQDGARAANTAAGTGGALPVGACRVLINGEPTESCLAVGSKGALRCVLATRGRAAHSAYPHLGDSATLKLVRLLAELDTLPLPEHPILGPTTVNIGALSGGVADNVIAAAASARLFVRLVTEPDETIEVLERWLGDRGKLTVETTASPVLLGTVPGFPTTVVAFASDVPHLTNWGMRYLYGPGSIHVAHTDDEYVSVAELRASVDAYVKLADGALGL